MRALLAQDGRHVRVEHRVVDRVRPARAPRRARRRARRRTRARARPSSRQPRSKSRCACRAAAQAARHRSPRTPRAVGEAPAASPKLGRFEVARARCRSPATAAAAASSRPRSQRSMSGLACTIGQTIATGSPSTRRELRAASAGRGSRPAPPPARLARPWNSCIGAQNGTLASSMPRFSAAVVGARRERTRSKPSSWRKVAKNGNSPLSRNSSVSATRLAAARLGRDVARAGARCDQLPRARGTGRARGRAASAWRVPLSYSEQPPPQVKRLPLAADDGAKPVDAAVVAGAAAAVRRVADEGAPSARRCASRNRAGSSGARSRQASVRAGEQRDAERADRARVGRDDDLAAGLARHRGGQRVGGEGHALAEDHLADRAAALHAVQVVLDDRVVEAGDDRRAARTPAATASSMISAMNTEQCWPSETPCGGGERLLRRAAPRPRCRRTCGPAPR